MREEDFAPNALASDWQRRVWKPILNDPPLCTLAELNNGTYSIDDLADMIEICNLMSQYKIEASKK